MKKTDNHKGTKDTKKTQKEKEKEWQDSDSGACFPPSVRGFFVFFVPLW
jgi:hypothetical protein